MLKQTGRHVAQTDGGTRYVVLEFQEYLASRALDEETQWIPGMKEYRLESGGRVNYVDDDTFEIVTTGAIIKRVR
jgi:hypothetical protein